MEYNEVLEKFKQWYRGTINKDGTPIADGIDPPPHRLDEEGPPTGRIDGVHRSVSFEKQMRREAIHLGMDLKECLEKGWVHVQSTCRPDESFRAMIVIMQKWMQYMDSLETKHDIYSIMRERGLDPVKAFPTAVISRLEDIGRAKNKLKEVLDHPIFDDLSKHNPYWEDKDEDTSEKLYDIRCRLRTIEDNLQELHEILTPEDA